MLQLISVSALVTFPSLGLLVSLTGVSTDVSSFREIQSCRGASDTKNKWESQINMMKAKNPTLMGGPIYRRMLSHSSFDSFTILCTGID